MEYKICKNCKNKVHRAPSQSKRSKSGHVFCSRSCSAIFNNKNLPKRKLSKTCKICKILIKSDLKYCKDCWTGDYVRKHYLHNKTLEEAIKNRKDNNRYNQIRQISRKNYFQSGRPKCCEVCGYDKHIEICHIKDIASFYKQALIYEINDLSNLIALCRNHHWELDHGHLTIEEIKSI